jgi:hypothetical protein
MKVLSTRRLSLICALCCILPFACVAQSKPITLDQILAGVQQTETEHQQDGAYTVTREYQLSAAGQQQPNSDVVAQVNFVSSAATDFSITKSEGSGRGTGIVRKVLDHETQMASHPELHSISPANYDFALLGEEAVDGHKCYVLQLKPKRQAVELIDGKAWIDTDDFSVRRVQGRTAKSPSLWIKNLNLTINLGKVDGVWVQTSTQAVADVRLVGPHVLTSRELDVRRATISAQAQPPARVHQRRNSRHVIADSAAWLAR